MRGLRGALGVAGPSQIGSRGLPVVVYIDRQVPCPDRNPDNSADQERKKRITGTMTPRTSQ